MPDGGTISAVGLPPRKAIAYFRQKENVKSAHWDELWQEAHARGFTVAGAAQDALLADFRTAMAKAIEQGTTLAEFRRDFDSIVGKYGWQYHGTPGWRSEIIYSTNLSTAYSAGRYRQMTTPEALAIYPYWRYRHHTCPHPRPEHVAWDGMILRADDPWWDTHYPPNGWRCHCTVEVVSERDLTRNGWTVSDSPAVEMRDWRNPRTGVVSQVPVGIDPGFAYNPGKAWAQHEATRTPPASSFPPAQDLGPHRPAAPAHPEPSRPGVSHPAPLSDVQKRHAQANAVTSLLDAPVGTVEAGTLPEDVRHALGSDTASVRLSGETVEKQQHHHPDLTEEDYRALPEVLGLPDVVARQSDTHILLFRSLKAIYRAVIKRTRDGGENYLVSFHRTRPHAVQQALAKAEILRGAIDDLTDAGE